MSLLVLEGVGSLLAQKDHSTAPLKSVDASYATQEFQVSPSSLEKKTYSEKRRFWEDIARTKRESFQRSESEVSNTSLLTYHDSDSECLSEVRERSEDEAEHENSIQMDPAVDISECTVAEKAHYFEEQIQKEMSAARVPLKSQPSQESARIATARLSGISISSEDDRLLEVFEETERILEEKAKEEGVGIKSEKVEVKTWLDSKEEKMDDIMEKGNKKENKEEKYILDLTKDTTSHVCLEKEDLLKIDIRRKSKDGKDMLQKAIVKDEKKSDKQKLNEDKDSFEKMPNTVEVKSRKISKDEKKLLDFKTEGKESKIEYEKKESEKKMSKEKKQESPIKGKLESDIYTKEITKFDKTIIQEKGNYSEVKQTDKFETKAKVTTTIDSDKESKAKATKMQENVSKQQKVVDSTSPLTSIKSSISKEEFSLKTGVFRQKSKEESLHKFVATKQSSKEEPLSKSPSKKDKWKEESLSKSSPKKDKSREDVTSKISPKPEKIKETSASKLQLRPKKEQDIILKNLQSKKETLKQELSTSGISKQQELTNELIGELIGQKSNENLGIKICQTEIKQDTSEMNKYEKSDSKAEEFESLTENKLKNRADINVEIQETKVEQILESTSKLENQESIISKTKNETWITETSKVDILSEDTTTESTILQEPKFEKLVPDISKSVITQKTEPDTNIQFTTVQNIQNLQSSSYEKNKPIHATPKTIVEKKEMFQDQSVMETTVRSIKKSEEKLTDKEFKELIAIEASSKLYPKDDKVKDSSLASLPRRETSISEVSKSIIPKQEKLLEELPPKNEKSKDLPSLSPPKQEKPIGEIQTSVIPREKRLKEEFSITAPPKDDEDKNLLSSPHKQNKSINDIPKSMIPRREKLKEELTIKSSLKSNKDKDFPSGSLPQEEQSIDSIHKSMMPKREKSKEEISINCPAKGDEGKDLLFSLSKREKSVDEISKSTIPKKKKSNEEISIEPTPKENKDKDLPSGSLLLKERSIHEIPKSIIPMQEKSKEEFSISSKEKELPSAFLPHTEQSTGEIYKSTVPKRENFKEEFLIKSHSKGDISKDLSSSLQKREKSMDEIPNSIILTRQKSNEEFSFKSPSKDEKVKDLPSDFLPKRVKSIGEIPKSMISKREKSREEFSIKSAPKSDNVKGLPPALLTKREKSLDEIPKSMIPRREKSKEEFSIKSPAKDDKAKDLPSDFLPKREKSIGEIPKSMIPKREKSKEEFSIKSSPKDDKVKDLPTASLTKREKSSDEIPKSMIPRREKSKEEFFIKSPPKDDTVKDLSSDFLSKREKSIGEIPKSMIPKREKSKEEFSIKSSPKDDKVKDLPTASLTKREKSSDEIPKSMIPRREKSKEEFFIKSPPKDDKVKDLPSDFLPKREKSIGEIPKSMTPRREKSKEEFSIKSSPKDDKVKDLPTDFLSKREKSIGEIPKSVIPKREKSKEEFSIKSPPKSDNVKGLPAVSLTKREKSLDEIPKSMIPRREKSKEEFFIKSPPKDDKVKDLPSDFLPKREKSIGEIPKSMTPRREKSKEEFSIKSSPKDDKVKDLPTDFLSKREKSIGEIPKSMIPKREKSKEEFSIKSPPKSDNVKDLPTVSLTKREKSLYEIPKSMIPRKEKSKEEFSTKSPPKDDKVKVLSTVSLTKREKSIDEIPKSMIPRREKSKEEFSIKSPPKYDNGKVLPPTSLIKREKSIGEIPKSMIPRREKSKEEFSIKSLPKDNKDKDLSSAVLPKREKSVGEIPKSTLPKREKSKEEFSVKSNFGKSEEAIIPKREKSSREISKSNIPKTEKSKESLKSPPKHNKAMSFSSTAQKREMSKGEIRKPVIFKREKSGEDFSLKFAPARDKLKDDIATSSRSLARCEKSKEDACIKLAPKREKSKEEISAKINLKRNDSKNDQSIKRSSSTKSLLKRENSNEDILSKSVIKRRDFKEESSKSSTKKVIDITSKNVSKKEQCKEEVVKTSAIKRRDSKEVPVKSFATRTSSSSSSSFKSDSPSPKFAHKLEKKDISSKQEFERATVTKKEQSKEVTTQEYEEHTRKQVSESQVFSGTFTGDPKEALKLFEDTSALKNSDFVKSISIVTSKVNQIATMSLEKKETKSFEIDTGEEKIIDHEEKEDSEKKEISTSLVSRQSPEGKVEESESKIKITSVGTTQKALISSVNDFETVKASASQIGKESEHSITSTSIEDDQKITLTVETSTLRKDNVSGANVKIEKDLKDECVKIDDLGKIIEKSIFQEEMIDISKTLNEKHDFKSKSSASQNVSETFSQSDSSLLDPVQGKVQSPQNGTTESEIFHDELADDLTRKFETIMHRSTDAEQDITSCGLFTQEERNVESARVSASISSEDITKDESSSFQLSISQSKIPNKDITISTSSMSEQIEQIEAEELEESGNRGQKASASNVHDTFSSLGDRKFGSKTTIEGKFISELSGARVLEILEPENENQSRQDSMDVSSIEIDDIKCSSGVHDFPLEEILCETSIDSLETLERDFTVSSITLSEDTNIDYSLPRHSYTKKQTSLPKISIRRKTERDSFEIESPPLISPRIKVKDLEIKSVDWMIGDEKIEVSESLEPSEAFDKELEEYQSSLKEKQKQKKTVETKTITRKLHISQIEDSSSFMSDEPELVKLNIKPKFVVIPVSEQELEIEKDLVENKLDISCQELMETLQQEHDAKTPIDDRFEEIAAKSFHFTTADKDEDSFDKDKERYEVKEKLDFETVGDHNVKSSLPIETKTAVNVFETEHFTSLDEAAKVSQFPSDSKTDELIQLYEEQFDFKSDNEDKNEHTHEDKLFGGSQSFENTNFSEVKKEIKDNKRDIKNSILITSTGKSEEETKESITAEITSDDEKLDKKSYDLKNSENPSEKSELSLKLKVENDRKNIHLISYQVFNPEDAKKHTDFHGITGAHKPSKNEFHKEGKVDIRSKGWDDHKRLVEKREKSHLSHQEASHYKTKKEDFQNVDMSSRYAIKVLDQVVKKEIAEVKENLEAAKQDLIEELSENSETVIQIKDSPSEFQFKLQPESIPNELPFLYKASSLDKVNEVDTLSLSSSPTAKPRRHGEIIRDESSSDSSSIEKRVSDKNVSKTSVVIESASDTNSQKESKDIFESFSSSPKAASRSGSDVEGTTKDETFSLQPPQPAPRRRQKNSRGHRNVTSESEADVSSSGESNYQSCEYESASRPSSSDVEALHSAAQLTSITASEYETAAISFEHSSSKATSQDYYTAMNTLSSKESMKSLNSLSSGQMGSLDSSSELSETLIASESDLDKDEIDENLEYILDDDMKTSNYESDEESRKSFDFDPNIPCMMKRSSEMIFSEVINSDISSEERILDVKQNDNYTLLVKESPNIKSNISTEADGNTSASFNTIYNQPVKIFDDITTTRNEATEPKVESCSFEPDSLETKCTIISNIEDESLEDYRPGSGLSLQQQLSMTSSSMSGVSLETVIEKEPTDKQSPDSDSFELIDKPDIIDDFVVVEEVGREAEEFDSEGRGIRISSMSYASSKNYDREVENLIIEKQETQKVQADSNRSTGDFFDFESEESPPQALHDEQYSQSYSDEEQYNEGGKKWIEMQFQQNEARLYDLEYERGPLEDIKEEEITDFEAGSSRFGSVGSQKESIGSIGSMRGSFGSTPDNYDILTTKRYFKPTDHDNGSLSSLQEFEHLENAVAIENAKRREQQHSSSQDSSSNGSLPRRYTTSKSGHGDDISLSSVKDFEVLEKACKEAHLIELKAREEEDLLDHESPENRYKLENLARVKIESQESGSGSFNPSTSGSDDYEKRIKEIDEIIRLAQVNVEKIEKHDDTTDDVSQIDLTDTADKVTGPFTVSASEASVMHEPPRSTSEANIMETSTDSLELDGNGERNYNIMCKSSDSLELKTALDHPSISSDSLNNVKDPKDEQGRQFSSNRRISSDSLEFSVLESQDINKGGKGKDSISES